MITISVLLILWGIYSTYRIDKICKEQDEPFNILEGGFINAIGFVFGWGTLVCWVLALCLYYLP
jgi:hypothetical protein